MTKLKEKIKAAQIDLIKELGIDKLEKEQQEKIILQIGEIIQQRVVMRVIEELSDEKQDEFKGILDKAEENPQLVDDFLTENIPGIEDMVLEEIGDYKQGAVEFMKEALKGNVEEDSQTEEPLVQQRDSVDQEPAQKETQESSVEKSEVGEEVVEEGTTNTESAEQTSEQTLEQTSEDKPKETRIPNTPEVGGIEEEQAQKEAQILEENKVDNEVIEGEELDLTNEIEKMKTEEK